MPIETKVQATTAEKLRENIIRIAQNKGMSYDVISRRCTENGEEVSKSTVSAFFNNPDLDLGYKKLMALSRAVSGYDITIRDFTEPLPLKPSEEAEYMRDIMEAKKDRILDLESQFLEERRQHKEELSELKSEHKTEMKELREEYQKRFDAIGRDKRIWRSIALFVLFALFTFCIIDLIDTDSGWIQSAGIQGILNSGFVSAYAAEKDTETTTLGRIEASLSRAQEEIANDPAYGYTSEDPVPRSPGNPLAQSSGRSVTYEDGTAVISGSTSSAATEPETTEPVTQQPEEPTANMFREFAANIKKNAWLLAGVVGLFGLFAATRIVKKKDKAKED